MNTLEKQMKEIVDDQGKVMTHHIEPLEKRVKSIESIFKRLKVLESLARQQAATLLQLAESQARVIQGQTASTLIIEQMNKRMFDGRN